MPAKLSKKPFNTLLNFTHAMKTVGLVMVVVVVGIMT
jgi:hypothetical protein